MHTIKTIAETMTALLVPFTPDVLSRRPDVLPQSRWPASMEDTVDSLLSRMSAQDKAMVKATKREDLMIFHHGWAHGIRRYYGLESGNDALLTAACGQQADADRAAMLIVEAVWTELQHS
ncbi:DUF6794 domain-containing protein [Undibacterium terreum]|nr:DUF6794 domain-containing protein [Undibacterium terreum]